MPLPSISAPGRLSAQQPGPSGQIWVEATTLLHWRGQCTGIARTISCLLHEWLTQHQPVRLCRFDQARKAFFEVSSAEVLALLERPPSPVARAGAPSWKARVRAALRACVSRLPADLEPDVVEVGLGLVHLGRYVARVGVGTVRLLARSAQQLLAQVRSLLTGAQCPFEVTFAPGDVLLSPGGSWEDRSYLDVVEEWRRRVGLRLVPLVYDAIPHRFPQFFPAFFPPKFRAWLERLLGLADRFLTISEASRRDLRAFAEDNQISPPPIEVVRLGDTLPTHCPVTPPVKVLGGGGAPTPFVLTVGTVEVRKNHALVYQVWRRLIEERGPAAPPLVIAGRGGWLCNDLQDQLRDDPLVQGKIVLLKNLHDGELNWLYRNCLFTLYPSHYEGWGLPVCESLAHGKYCIASDRSSIPEIAGDLIDYHDPCDFAACKALVERALFDEAYRLGREAQIRQRYRKTSWADCAGAVGAILTEEVRQAHPLVAGPNGRLGLAG